MSLCPFAAKVLTFAIYPTKREKNSVALYARDGKMWLNQQQMAELFATSKPNISMHISNILKERELYEDSVVKEFLTTAADAEDIRMLEDLEKSIIENKQKGRE